MWCLLWHTIPNNCNLTLGNGFLTYVPLLNVKLQLLCTICQNNVAYCTLWWMKPHNLPHIIFMSCGFFFVWQQLFSLVVGMMKESYGSQST
jgi:hypothetical protein